MRDGEGVNRLAFVIAPPPHDRKCAAENRDGAEERQNGDTEIEFPPPEIMRWPHQGDIDDGNHGDDAPTQCVAG